MQTEQRSSWHGSVNLIILNSEHFILSADGERIEKILFFYAPSRDAIIVNEKAPYIDGLVELMATYLDLTDLKKKEVVEYTKDEAIREYFTILNRIVRIRRKLYKPTKHKNGLKRAGGVKREMDRGQIFEKLLHLAVERGITVRFCPFQASEGRLRGNRLGIAQDLNIDKINYNLAHEIAHSFLHYDKGNMIESPKREEYEEQADRAANMILEIIKTAFR